MINKTAELQKLKVKKDSEGEISEDDEDLDDDEIKKFRLAKLTDPSQESIFANMRKKNHKPHP